MVPIDYEEITVTTGAAIGLTTAKLNALAENYDDLTARILVRDATIAFLEHGATPTAATKQQAKAEAYIWIYSLAAMRKFLAIGVTATAYLAVTYFKQ